LPGKTNIMSARKNQPRKQPAIRKSAPAPAPKAVFVARHEPWPDDSTAYLRRPFWIVAALMLVLMFVLALRVGVNGDDSFQVDYSNKLLAFYSTMGRDTSALNVPKGNMHLYGGFFDIVAGVANKTLGYNELQPVYHDVRHILIALFGWGAMVLTGLFVALLAGWRGALVALVLMFVSPRFLGDGLMNPKDIPYAFGNILALYGMLRVFKTWPAWHWPSLVMMIAGMAIAEATRAGGILLFAYLGLFAGLHFLMQYGWSGLSSRFDMVKKYALLVFGGIAVAHVLAILFWPYALVSPVKNPLAALSNFSQLGIKIRLLFGGDNVMSDKTHWSYALQWIARTVPLLALFGFLAGLILIRPLWKSYARIGVFMAVFSVVFPLAYIIYKDSVLHDGWRHLYFVYPGMVVVTALVWTWLERRLEAGKVPHYALLAGTALLLAEPASFIARNPTHSYVYFNPLSGGMKGALGQFETDYWGVSIRQAVEWLDKEGHISPAMTDTVTIATNYLWNLERYVNERYRGKVKVAYLKWSRRYDYPWDYAIYPSRFVPAGQINTGNWPPKSVTIHTINANNVPICAILRDSTGYGVAAEAALKQNNAAAADSLLKLELAIHPDNELAWLSRAQIAFSQQRVADMKAFADKALAINPEDGLALNFVGLDQLQRNDINGALETFRRNVELNDDNYMSYYWSAMAYRQQNNLSQAAESAVKALEIAPQFRGGYQLLAEIYQQMGDNNRAAQVMQYLQQLPGQ